MGTKKGFRIYNCDPFGKFYENGLGQSFPFWILSQGCLEEGGAGICEMMFASSIVAIAGTGEPATFSPRKLRIFNTKVQAESFSSYELLFQETNGGLWAELSEQDFGHQN